MKIDFTEKNTVNIDEIKNKRDIFLESGCIKIKDEYFCKSCESVILVKWLTVEKEGVSNHLQIPYCPKCEKNFKIDYVPCAKD